MSVIEDLDSGDSTPELTRASVSRIAEAINLLFYNVEVPLTGTPGSVVMHRNLSIINDLEAQPAVQTDGYGVQLGLSHTGTARCTLLHQSVSTNDERVYLLGNASPEPGDVYTNVFVYDKTGAAATYYLQRSGEHVFTTAPVGTIDTPVTFTERVKIDSTGLLVSGRTVVTTNSTSSVSIANFTNSANSSSLNIASVGATNEYVQGSFVGDTAIRSESNNLVIGSSTGNTTIGTSTKVLTRFNSNGTVVIPVTNSPSTTYGGVAIGSGLTLVVGSGSNSANDTRALWFYKDNAPSFIGGGMQFNAQNGFDFWVGNTASAWVRPLQLQTNGKVLVGGVQSATAIADLHINALGVDNAGSLSLTGLSTASYILLGNRDSGGTAGPAIIASSNRQIQFGVGDSFNSRSGGNFTQTAVISGGSLGIGTTNPEAYDKFVVDVHGTTTVTQLFRTFVSPGTGNVSGNLAGGYGIHWGNVFIGNRAIHGGDANNAGLAFMVAYAGTSNEAGRFSNTGDLTVRGNNVNLGTNNFGVLSVNAIKETYLRGDNVSIQNSAATSDLLTVNTSVFTMRVDAVSNGNLTVNGTLISSRQIEKTSDKAISSGIVTFDYNTASLWMTNAATANWTCNFTNVNTTTGQATTVSIIHQQGSTGYFPSAVQINGVNAAVKWAGGMAPVPTPNNIDLFMFTLIRTTSDTWIVLASATPYV